MNITAFYPTVLTATPEKVIRSAETMGFSVIHQRSGVIDPNETEYVLENEQKQRMDVVHVPSNEKDVYSTRMNVDDFDDALKTLLAEGYSLIKGPHVLPSSKNALLRSSTNLEIMLMQHL